MSTKSWTKPTPDQVDTALASLAHPQHIRYFFDRLENPHWIEPLDERGWFRKPPAPEPVGKGRIQLPLWPASRYLARVAKHSPKAVTDIILKMPATQNARVLEDLADIALILPPSQAVRLIPRMIDWVKNPYLGTLSDKLAALMGELAVNGYGSDALRLARALFEVSAPESTGHVEWRTPRPHTTIDQHEYRDLLRSELKRLVQGAGIDTLKFLSDLLETSVRVALHDPSSAGGQDMSFIWRPAIEDHQQNRHEGVRAVLTESVRDAAELICASDPSVVPVIVAILESRRWAVFRRIALHLLRRFPGDRDLLRSHLTNKELFIDPHFRHEYAALLREQFQALDAPAQNTILGWIEEGPDPSDVEQLVERHQAATNMTTRKEEIERYRKAWQVKNLSLFGDSLPEQWKQKYQSLVAEAHEPKHADFPYYSSGVAWGPRTPKTAEDLGSLSLPELRQYLLAWEPKTRELGFAPSAEGLAREITKLIAGNPAPYVQSFSMFQELDPTYIRSALRGVIEAIGKDNAFSWDNVLELCRWVLNQERTIDGRSVDRMEADPDWTWTFKTIAELLNAGLKKVQNAIPHSLKGKVWVLLEKLSNDEHPTVENEAKWTSNTPEDHFTHAINTIRGTAMEALIHYALWIRRYLESLPEHADRIERGFDEMPEVRKTLEKHLSPTDDPSLAIRSVYGAFFPWLTLLDRKWTESVTKAIFPEAQPLYREAAWSTYISFCDPYNDCFALLRSEYLSAIQRFSSEPTQEARSHRHQRLAQHLMVYYWRGLVAFGDQDQLLETFFSDTNDSLRATALDFVGRSMKDTPGALEPEIKERFTFLWDWRFERAKESPAQHEEELAAFGWWFVSDKLDPDWSLQRLLGVLRLIRKVDFDHEVVEKLTEMIDQFPHSVLEALKLFAAGAKEGWGFYSWEPHLHRVLKITRESPDVTIRKASDDIIHILGQQGQLQFRPLLSRSPLS